MGRFKKELKTYISCKNKNMKYLFDEWQDIIEIVKDKRVSIFLDFDGTLSPIASTPQQAFLSSKTKELLKALSKNPRFNTAIISGRALKDIKEKVGLKNIIYVGNHGAQIEGPKIKFSSMISQRSRIILERIKSGLAKKLSSIRGVILEDKGFSLSLHYRMVDKKDVAQVKTILHEAVIIYLVTNKIKLKTGKMVFEISFPSKWDKGKVVMWLLARQRFAAGKESLVPIYLGDDKTDEDAFKALKNKGLTIFIGRPKPSHAQFYLKNTREVVLFLDNILRLK